MSCYEYFIFWERLSRISSHVSEPMVRTVSGQVMSGPASRTTEQNLNRTTTTSPCFVGRALVAVCPAPPSCIPAVHSPLVRRRPATSPAGTASTRACSQVRPGRSRRARRRSAIGQRRRHPATVPPRRRDVKKEHDFLIILLVLFLTIQLAVVLILLFRPPQDPAPSAS